ncbi:MaoC family dehydratase [Paraburkholderia unamae]|jgi:acyl dehydratase|uniref:Acyl dehydratase n=1 Tax=Paraburkholderia unamae TaxID=219649 RepID=A0ABX5KPS9_9BURK|nr:MaoC family dehydratase [Paraburkholderia unamae]PVX84403.1 acyl dehydratase [Paraburkholderia unamae]CAG9247927.1 3-hydroxyacyl-thioester dehydratase Z [Paraburkholderia unamae]
MKEVSTLAELEGLIGQTLQSDDWFPVEQNDIDLFARATGDHQWIHTDPERARRESPFGVAVAHGFLTLSLLPVLMSRTIKVQGVRMGVNYGLNRVRFTAPVPVASRVRLQAALREVKIDESPAGKSATLTWSVTMEMQGAEKPVCVAETLSRLYF